MQPQIALLMTGDELISGDSLDTNSQFFCQELSALGLRVKQVVTCGDDQKLLSFLIKRFIASYDLLIINGGLGPTEDDFTFSSLAVAIDKPLKFSNRAYDNLKRRKQPINSAQAKQAWLPQGARVIDNNYGSAPAAFLKAGKCAVFCTPGVPREMKPLWHESIKPRIKKIFSQAAVKTLYARSFGLAEAHLQQLLNDNDIASSDAYSLGFRAHFPYVDCKLTTDKPTNYGRMEQTSHRLKKLLGAYLLPQTNLAGDGVNSIAAAVVGLLTEQKKTVSLAESVTGGHLAALLTSPKGASMVFHYGLVSYGKAAKKNLLKISPKLLQQPVSPEVAISMAHGVSELAKSDYSLALTGFADQPSDNNLTAWGGCVYVCWVEKSAGFHLRKLKLKGSRQRIQFLAACIALDGLRRLILGLKPHPQYSFDSYS